MFALKVLVKLVEQVPRIVWSRAGFGVVLHAAYGSFPMVESFNGTVVEVDVCQNNFVFVFLEHSGINGKSVVLTGDLPQLCLKVEYRMVGAAVPVVHFERLHTHGNAQKLMP